MIPSEVIIPMITAIISGGFTAFAVVIKAKLTRKDSLSHAFNELSQTLDQMEAHISQQERRIQELQTRLQEYERLDDEKTMYIRRVGHWFDKACAILDPEWLAANPKPKLPESLRNTIGKDKLS